jgi:hypothetical protein
MIALIVTLALDACVQFAAPAMFEVERIEFA